MPDVTPGGLPYPLSSEPIADGAEAIEDLAVAVDGRFASGLRANRPAAGVLGRQYFATDTISVFLDTGTSWVPVGASAGDIVATAAAAATTGWVLANGAAVSRSGMYADVFAAVGTAYGAGNGSTTFNLPDLRGRVPVGVDGAAARLTANDALGNSGGAETHTLTPSQTALRDHAHSVDWGLPHVYWKESSVAFALGSGSGGSAIIDFVGAPQGGTPPTTKSSAPAALIEGVGGKSAGIAPAVFGQPVEQPGAPHNNMQPYQVVNYQIKL